MFSKVSTLFKIITDLNLEIFWHLNHIEGFGDAYLFRKK